MQAMLIWRRSSIIWERQVGRLRERIGTSLPLLTPEYQHDVAGFSRRFFRDLFDLLPSGAAVVLDNYQEVDTQHPFHALVANAIAEIPAEWMLLVVADAIRRTAMPDWFQ